MHKKMMGAALAVMLLVSAISPVAMAASRYEILQEGDKDGNVYSQKIILATKIITTYEELTKLQSSYNHRFICLL